MGRIIEINASIDINNPDMYTWIDLFEIGNNKMFHYKDISKINRLTGLDEQDYQEYIRIFKLIRFEEYIKDSCLHIIKLIRFEE